MQNFPRILTEVKLGVIVDDDAAQPSPVLSVCERGSTLPVISHTYKHTAIQ